MGFGKGFTARPGDKVVHAAPPGFHFVVALGVGVCHESATLMIKANRSRAVNFVANESRRLVDQVHAITKTVLEIDFMSLRDRDTVSDNNHHSTFYWNPAC